LVEDQARIQEQMAKKILFGFEDAGDDQVGKKNAQADQRQIEEVQRVANPISAEFDVVMQNQLLALALPEDAPGQKPIQGGKKSDGQRVIAQIWHEKPVVKKKKNRFLGF
jgi:hypothetical protein